MTSHFAVLALATVTTGCSAEPPPVANGSSLAKQLQATQARMHVRFAAAQRIEEAISHSDLDSAHREAAALGALEEPDALPQWRPYLDRIVVWSHQVALAPDVVVAAKATAQLGHQCAHCHEAITAKIAFPPVPRPPVDIKLKPQMLGHQWAASRMWEGLIGPSEERWIEGAQALTEVPLTIVADEPMTVALHDSTLADGDKIGDDIARVRLYAKRALAPHDADARTELFGDLLATCAHCHSVIRDR